MFKYSFCDDIHTEKSAAGVTCFRISAGSDFEKWYAFETENATGV